MDRNIPLGDKGNGEKFKVLLVDDSAFVLKQLKQILQSEGFEILDTAEDGEEGLEKFKKHSADLDLVTLDITMPKMDGITTLEKIIEYDKEATVIMISALGKEDLVKKALVTGAKNYIVKPLNREKVLERLVSVLKK
ncbi:MAG: response regulator [Spirochaetes bacterium]|nr:response regulator [Spirochaetota bacterium]